MSNVSDIYTLWLKPWHLPAGKPISVTIQKVETRIIHPRPTEERTALILSFAGKNRKLILNDGNANKMSDIGGEDWAAWQGLVIQLKRVQFTKDKETIHILPDTSPMGKSASLQPVVTTPEPIAEDEALTVSPPTNGNGHTEKPYRFPSTAAEKFFKQVQQATDNFYKTPPEMIEVIGGWFNFASQDLWDEKLGAAIDHARQKRQAELHPELVEGQPVEVESQEETA